MTEKKKRFGGNKKNGTSLVHRYEQRLVKLLTPIFSPFIETYQLTLLTIVWAGGVIICSYFATANVLWLWGVSGCIVAQYLTDLFDGAVGREKETGLIRWGYYMDHLLDYSFLCAIIIGYSYFLADANKDLALFWLALFGVFMVNSFLQFAITNRFRVVYFTIGPTEVRIGFIVLNCYLLVNGIDSLSGILPFILISAVISLIIVIIQTQRGLWQDDMRARQKVKGGEGKKLYKRYIQFSLKLSLVVFISSLLYSGLYVYLTDPFNTLSIVKAPFTTSFENDQLRLDQHMHLDVKQNSFTHLFAFYKAGIHIFANTYVGSKKAEGNTEKEIIAQIHALRFNPKYPYLISGDQFSVLYPRNLGVFYHSLLDTRTALNKTDWQNRERIYLQTVAYALETFTQIKSIHTTIIPIGVHTVTGVNIYAYPSDALYGILYALAVMEGKKSVDQTLLYPTAKTPSYTLETINAAREVVEGNKSALIQLVQTYSDTVYDPHTGFVRSIPLSSARDAAKRQSSFYDNVIYWKTMALARDLGLTQTSSDELISLRKRVLTEYWNESEGHFSDDQSSIHSYSSDWLIVLPTGFLAVTNPEELEYIKRSVQYVRENKIDEPFPISYVKRGTKSDAFSIVHYFVPSYGSEAIWSYWGTEYCKALLLLYQQTKDKTYQDMAEKHLQRYAENIVKYKGFPETYDTYGNMLTSPVYTSIRQTGWVVDYEQAQLLLTDTNLNTARK